MVSQWYINVGWIPSAFQGHRGCQEIALEKAGAQPELRMALSISCKMRQGMGDSFETWESKIHLGSGLTFCPKNIDPQNGERVGDVEVVDCKPVNLWGDRKVLVGNVMDRNCQPLCDMFHVIYCLPRCVILLAICCIVNQYMRSPTKIVSPIYIMTFKVLSKL